jgi:hypothetical protein
MDKRQEFVSALEGVDGVTAYAIRPATYTEPGTAWYVQDSLVRDKDSGQFENTVKLAVFLHQDEEKAAQWFSDHWELIVEALDGPFYVDKVDLVNLGDSNTAQFTMQITARSE